VRVCEDPSFLGKKLYTEVRTPQNWLVLGQQSGLWDDQTANMDTWADVDVLPFPSGTTAPQYSAGTYTFSNQPDASGVIPIRLSSEILAFPFSDPNDFIDNRFDNCDSWPDWDVASADYGGQVTMMIRTTNDDPAALAASWSDWQIFNPGEYTARGFQFQALLSAPIGQNIGIEQLCVTGDFKQKYDQGADVPYSAVNTRVYFHVKFYSVPAVVTTLQLAMAEDRIELPVKTREYFEVKITQTSSGTNPVGARSFDWHAQGY